MLFSTAYDKVNKTWLLYLQVHNLVRENTHVNK